MSWLDYDRFAVFGLGVSGIAASNLLARRGKTVVASDPRGENALAESLTALHPDVQVVLGKNEIHDAQVVVLSPGLKPSLPVVRSLDGLHVISEIELGWSARQVPLIGVTGTDGKSTTTTLLAHLINRAGGRAVAAGNIGTPICDVVDDIESGFIIAEVSAFQLWSTHDFHVPAGVFTNIAADHLDYFETWDEYVDAKRRMARNCKAEDLIAFNWDDSSLREWGTGFDGRVAWYSAVEEPRGGDIAAWVAKDKIWLRDARGTHAVVDLSVLDDVGLRGPHNYANFMSAFLVALNLGFDVETLVSAVAGFKPLAHRCEKVARVNGVTFYDDSKATNVNAALAGISSVAGDLVVIAGGVDKGLELDEFARTLRERAKHVVLIGAIQDRLARELENAEFPSGSISRAETMQEAVRVAFDRAKPDASVLLSPACSSFDMFESYAHRGDVFQQAVRELG